MRSHTHTPHILFHSPSTHLHMSIFSCTFIPFLGFFPCLPPPFYVAPSRFLTLSLFCACIHIHTQTHTVILSLSHQGTLIKLGWSLMLSPRQQSPWRGWLFQKEKKNMRILQPYDMHRALRTHRVRHTNMHKQLDKQSDFIGCQEHLLRNLEMNIGKRDISPKSYTTSFMSSQDSRVIICSSPVGVRVCVDVDVCMSQWGKTLLAFCLSIKQTSPI